VVQNVLGEDCVKAVLATPECSHATARCWPHDAARALPPPRPVAVAPRKVDSFWFFGAQAFSKKIETDVSVACFGDDRSWRILLKNSNFRIDHDLGGD
jgi:hypothetical protein